MGGRPGGGDAVQAVPGQVLGQVLDGDYLQAVGAVGQHDDVAVAGRITMGG